MRPAVLAVPLCLLAAATAAGQAPPAAPPSPATQLTTSVGPPTDPTKPGCAACDGAAAIPDGPAPLYGPRFWASAEYLLWWVTPMNTPELIQSVPTAAAGNGTGTLPGGAANRVFPSTRQLEFGAFSGVRGTVGYAFDRFGVEASGFYLGRQTQSASLSSDGTPFAVGRSYVSAGNGQPIVLFASLAGQYTGGVVASADSRLWGFDANARLPFYNFLTNYTHLLGGFRYLNLEEHLNVASRSTFPDGTSLDIRDAVRTRNQFYGGQVGVNGRIGGMDRGLGLDLTGKMALGGVHQQVDLAGTNAFLTPGAPADVQAGGLYARGANLGSFSRDKFAAVFSADANLTYNFSPNAQVFFGYSITWISSVQRPGEAIDEVINDSQLRFIANPTPSLANRPAFTFRANDFWAQGMNFGFRWQY
jgi:hypothetical protein